MRFAVRPPKTCGNTEEPSTVQAVCCAELTHRRKAWAFTKDSKTLDDLFVHTLRDIYYAEQQMQLKPLSTVKSRVTAR
jgi:hypothetical protein